MSLVKAIEDAQRYTGDWLLFRVTYVMDGGRFGVEEGFVVMGLKRIYKMRSDGRGEGAMHSLKTWPEFFAPLASGQKTFEVRKNDRNFQKGDYLFLRQWRPPEGETR